MTEHYLNSWMSGKIETAKRLAGVTDKQIAKAGGIAVSTLYNKRSQETLPTLTMLAFAKILEFCGLEMIIREKEK